MNDYLYKDILIYIMRQLGNKKQMLEFANDPDNHKYIVNYIRYKSKFIKDEKLLSFINYFLI
jgi:hypothetical protein